MTNRTVGAPANLRELKSQGATGYEIKVGHFLKIRHQLMGEFPAEVRDMKEPIVTIDRNLLIDVWERLLPRDSLIDYNYFYVNESAGVCYSIMSGREYDEPSSKPINLFTRKDFEELVSAGNEPFVWSPGLIGAAISDGEFRRLIKQARKILQTVV